uniref:transposase n=1 Tax=Palleronia rufa TaxID=1530186 RepID=UPI001F26AE02|nr:transposase [Palleronia rufa]
MIPFSAFDPANRKIIHTTNAIESLNRVIRRPRRAVHSPPMGPPQTDRPRHPHLRKGWQTCQGTVRGPQPVRQNIRRAPCRSNVSRNRMGRAGYIEFRTLPRSLAWPVSLHPQAGLARTRMPASTIRSVAPQDRPGKGPYPCMPSFVRGRRRPSRIGTSKGNP